ncbi:MAG: M20 family metallopeptidase [Clostridia bacterium]|nr:M20 family metallopeptidase [Clostridia bacterium]
MKDKQRIDEIAAALAPELKELAHYIHDNPELSMQEYKACKKQVALFRKHGWDVEEYYDGFDTAFRAVYRSGKGGPKIAFCSEYDALPGMGKDGGPGHACGHNIIAMVACGAGLTAKEFADKYGGEIYVYGCPGEEWAGRKVFYARDGLMDDMDAVMMVHPSCTATDSWNSTALYTIHVDYYGKAAHAGAAPHEGINALDALELTHVAIGFLRQQTKDDARISYHIRDGGKTPGTIHEHTHGEIFVRANRKKYAEELVQKIKNICEGQALATGCRLELVVGGGAYMDTFSNQVLSRRATGYVEEQGVPCYWFNGHNHPGASDLGNVSYRAPSIQLLCKIADSPEGDLMGIHTPYMEEAAGTDEAMDTAMLYVKALVAAAIDLMTEPEFLAEIKEEFRHVND